MKEAIPDQIDQFVPRYWGADAELYLDEGRQFFKYLGGGEEKSKGIFSLVSSAVRKANGAASSYLASVEGGGSNLTGEGFVLGGLLVVRQGGAIQLAHSESTFGDLADLDSVIDAARVASAASAEPLTPPPKMASSSAAMAAAVSAGSESNMKLHASVLPGVQVPEADTANMKLSRAPMLSVDTAACRWTQSTGTQTDSSGSGSSSGTSGSGSGTSGSDEEQTGRKPVAAGNKSEKSMKLDDAVLPVVKLEPTLIPEPVQPVAVAATGVKTSSSSGSGSAED